MAPTKQTKKFEKNRLKDTLERRKATAKVKQRAQITQRKPTKNTRDAEFLQGPKKPISAGASQAKGRKVNEMSVDDFFRDEFEITSNEAKKGKEIGAGKKRKRQDTHAVENKKSGDEAGFSAGDNAEDDMDQDSFGSLDDDKDADDEVDMGMNMADLAHNDPDFYKFLKENDPEALDFNADTDLAEVDDLSSSDSDANSQPRKKRRKDNGQTAKGPHNRVLTCETVAGWHQNMTGSHSLRATRQAVIAFRCCAHINEVDDNETDPSKGPRYKIESADVFNDVVTLALKQIPVVIQKHVPIKESASGKTRVQTETKKFKTLSMLLKTYTASVLHLLGTLSDAKTLNMTLAGLLPLTPYLLSFRKLLRVLVRTVVRFWAQPASAESTRISAFLVMRRLTVIGDRSLRELVLKEVYQGLVQGSRITNPNTLPGINLMKNSAAELWGVDESVGYTTGFKFIRQLAIHLRNSIVNNKNDAFRAVYNWQYTHSLDFWSCVLAEHCAKTKIAESGKESQLKLLVYPLVQVTLGAMRLIPTSMYFPLRFHLVRSLLRISRATGTYIPLAPVLIEVLDSAEMKRPPKPTTQKPLDFTISYKAPKALLRSRTYQDGIADQLIELLAEFLCLWSANICFPEFSLPTLIQIKRWMKITRFKSTGNKNQRMGQALGVLVQKIEATVKDVERRRARVEFTPRDRAGVDKFAREAEGGWEKTPLGAYLLGLRRQREEKVKVLEKARKDEDKKRKEEEDEEKVYEGDKFEGREDGEVTDAEMEEDVDGNDG